MGRPMGRATGFGARARHAFASLKSYAHKVSWGIAGLSFVAGYFLPTTLSNLGVGWLAYDYVPGWQKAVDTLYQGSYAVTGELANPWDNGGLVGAGKLAGGGWLAKMIYDFEQTGQIGRGKLNVGIPFALGLLLDGPELHPMAGQIRGAPTDWTAGAATWDSGPVAVSQGGAVW